MINQIRFGRLAAMRIVVTNHKGGVGKSITAFHLAAYLGLRYGEGSTAVVDTDPNRSMLLIAERANESGYRLPFSVVSEAGQTSAEHVVYDSPGRLYPDELAAVGRISDLVVVPSTIDSLSVDALAGFVRDYQREAGPDARYRIVLTMIPWWDYFRARQARRELTEVGAPLFTNWVRLRPAFSRAAELGTPVYEIDTKGARDGWQDYKAIAEEAVEAIETGAKA